MMLRREDAGFSRQLTAGRRVLRQLALEQANDNDRQNARDDEHYRVPRNGVLWAVLAENLFRRGAEQLEKLHPDRPGISHLEVVDRLAEIVVDEFYDQRHVMTAAFRK